MDVSHRALPHLVLSAFTLLVVGGMTLSLATAPPVAARQLHLAAEATLAAPSFALVDTNSVTALVHPLPRSSLGSLTRTQVVRVRFQSPDRVQETGPAGAGRTLTFMAVGDRRFLRQGSQWHELPRSPGLGAGAVQTVLLPFRAAASATPVVRHGQTYLFVPSDLGRLVATLLGTNASQLTSLRFSATVGGEYLTGEQVTGVLGHQRLEVSIRIRAVGTAPPITVPVHAVPTSGSVTP